MRILVTILFILTSLPLMAAKTPYQYLEDKSGNVISEGYTDFTTDSNYDSATHNIRIRDRKRNMDILKADYRWNGSDYVKVRDREDKTEEQKLREEIELLKSDIEELKKR